MNKTAVVTGAAGNLGRAVLNQLLQDEFEVVGTKLPKESLDDFKDKKNFYEYVLNVTETEAVEKFVKHLVKKYDTVDRAALLVGGFTMGDIENTSLENVQAMLRLNFESAFVSAKYFFEQMTKQPEGGRIVLIGARTALDPKAARSQVAYALSKSLIFQMADILNASGKDKGVHTSVIVPSILDTPPNRNSMPEANFDDWVKPEEVAEVISFLFSDTASKIRESVVKIYGNA